MNERIRKSVEEIRNSPKGVRFSELKKICEHYFGECRIRGSHHVFKTPWPADPRVNIQDDGTGKAKVYQVTQVLKAIDFLAQKNGTSNDSEPNEGK